jgi:hypothetical protein
MSVMGIFQQLCNEADSPCRYCHCNIMHIDPARWADYSKNISLLIPKKP